MLAQRHAVCRGLSPARLHAVHGGQPPGSRRPVRLACCVGAATLLRRRGATGVRRKGVATARARRPGRARESVRRCGGTGGWRLNDKSLGLGWLSVQKCETARQLSVRMHETQGMGTPLPAPMPYPTHRQLVGRRAAAFTLPSPPPAPSPPLRAPPPTQSAATAPLYRRATRHPKRGVSVRVRRGGAYSSLGAAAAPVGLPSTSSSLRT